ncbi:hypothetical protein DX903_05795 [Adlercreutzia equolifaciens]|nr:hypothetical protein DX903_05795 [Adlercreutzia equolifaciens]
MHRLPVLEAWARYGAAVEPCAEVLAGLEVGPAVGLGPQLGTTEQGKLAGLGKLGVDLVGKGV